MKINKLLCCLLILGMIAHTPLVLPVNRSTKGVRVSNGTIQKIKAFLAIDPAAATIHEFQQKYSAAQQAVALLPERLKNQYQAEIEKKHHQGRGSSQLVVSGTNKKGARKEALTVSTQTGPLITPTAQNDTADSQLFTTREMVGSAAALALILGYEFWFAPTFKTKQLGLASYYNALKNGHNPFTAQSDQSKIEESPAIANNGHQEPGFFKKFGFDLFLSLFGL